MIAASTCLAPGPDHQFATLLRVNPPRNLLSQASAQVFPGSSA